MRVIVVVVRDPRDHDRIPLVLDINNCEGVLIVAETDLLSGVALVWAMIDNTLGIVHVSVIIETAGILGIGRFIDIYHMKASPASAGAYRVHVSRLFVADDVVC